MPPVVLLSLHRRLCPIANFFLFGLEAVIVLCWALLRGSRRRVERRSTAATEAGWLWRIPVAAPAMAAAPPAGEPGSAPPVQGEQVQHAIPAGWTLAWMDGDRNGNGNGEVLAEYLPLGEDLQSSGASQPSCTAQGE